MKCFIRVDSSTIMGSGHFMRCLVLAKFIRKAVSADIFFICRDLDGNVAFLARESGFSVLLLPPAEHKNDLSGYESWLTVTLEQDANDTIDAIFSSLEGDKADYIIVDNYAIDETWERRLRPFVKKIFVIDDLANRKHDCDFLLDQTYGIENTNKYIDLVPSKCVRFFGTSYSLLKSDYRKLRKEIDLIRYKVQNVMVFFGGSDDTGETVKVLKAIKYGKFNQYHFIVIVGESNPKKDFVKACCENLDNVEFHCQVENMEHYISISDIALASAGVNTWERCILGLPSIITMTADNQHEIVHQMREKSAAIILGSYESINCEDYIRVLNDIDNIDIVSLSKNAASLMEKDGIDYLLKVIGEAV